MTDNIPDITPSSLASLSFDGWQLHICAENPDSFSLTFEKSVVFSGKLALINNLLPLEIDHSEWRFRVKDNQIEQWCNVRGSETLSIGMTYTFRNGSLVIEYLARNSVPTRLDIGHKIQSHHVSHSPLYTQNSDQEVTSSWQRQYHEQPSDYLIEASGRDFREAFSATQWLVLNVPQAS